MRLTHLKLAGFKSFVDPTTLHIHGQRVGVVGPNGCGKSNVIEAIRWVMGESSAREMRGDSMQDVIFNGSGTRKPISRASVELNFDNSLGSAGSEWAQYAEIVVKRVLERDSGSTYYINNMVVRRRDVADLFLGTGLGGRAYAIIGQNTISRIVEAKPEELRIFLEEAAGISKYKERRRETELRLRDTRENLTRLEDIRREMENQITRLDAQAQITDQYQRLQQALNRTQGQLWLLRKRNAGASWEKSKRQVEKLVIGLEAQIAQLRKTESDLEKLRLEYHAGTESVQAAQGKYYEANAEVSTLEQQMRHTQEGRERLTQQLQQLSAQLKKIELQNSALNEELVQLVAREQQALGTSEQAEQVLMAQRKALPVAEQEFTTAQQTYSLTEKALTGAEQHIRLDSAHLQHLDKACTELNQRLQQLQQEQSRLVMPDQTVLTQKQRNSQQAVADIAALERTLADLRAQEQQHTEQIKQLQQQQQAAGRALAQTEAQMASLQKIQPALGHESGLDSWLERHGMAKSLRLWQTISVASGWETALEAVLGARLNALIVTENKALTPAERPPSALVLCNPTAADLAATTMQHGWEPMTQLITHADPKIGTMLQDWLAGVYVVDKAQDANQARARLKANEALVNKAGDVYRRHSVTFHAAQSALHGVLERQRELAELGKLLPSQQQLLQQLVDAISGAEQALHGVRESVAQQQPALKTLIAKQHELNLDIQRLQQQSQHALDRQRHLEAEQSSIQQRLTATQLDIQQKQAALDALQNALASLQQNRDTANATKQTAESAMSVARNSLQQSERQAQEQAFNKKLIVNNINEINNKIQVLSEENKALLLRRQETETMLAATTMETLKTNLATALENQHQRETELSDARNTMAGTEQQLQEMERSRMQSEQELHPQRDKLEQGRLQEQQARLHFEHCQAELKATGLDEAVLAENLAASAKVADMELEAVNLDTQITELGPVNLAAIQELASERERKSYLDSQALDLEQAITTLEEAIHRIDRETRSRLQHTFDETNRHFAELFGVLFGGGQARLELLGEEILDTGMQVFAQPPGKKNSTIHLLSGGEKALTALALVFALFRLNPAPFCLMDEVDAPLDDSNTERFCAMVKKMSERTQFLFVSHNKITMEMAQQLIGVTMQESGVSRIVEVDIEAAMQMQLEATA